MKRKKSSRTVAKYKVNKHRFKIVEVNVRDAYGPYWTERYKVLQYSKKLDRFKAWKNDFTTHSGACYAILTWFGN